MSKTPDRVIVVDKLVKNFEVIDRKIGLWGAVESAINPKKKTVPALRGVSFSINEGELIGFIGPNGAGKTTTLKTLSGLLYPTSGLVQVLGWDPWERRAEFLRQISLVMGQKNQLWWDLPAMETFELNRAIYEIPKSRYKETLSELVEMLEVKDILGIQVRRLSLGQRMRLELIAALLHQPRILFLDEPTIGLDVIAQQKMREFITKYNKKYKATILLTSHNMHDLVDLVNRVIVIDKGEIVFDGNLNELAENFAKEKIIKVSLSAPADIKKLNHIGKVKKSDFPEVIISVPRKNAAFAAAEILQNLAVVDLNIEEEPIENIVRRVFKKGVSK